MKLRRWSRTTTVGWTSRSSSETPKGHRFGMKVRWTQSARAEYVERMYLLVAVALLL
jgi:hypothetical protein